MYEIVILPKAAKQLRKLPLEVQVPLTALIDDLAIAPRPDGVKKLKGESDQYRIRYRQYRVVYSVQDQRLVVTVLKVGHRASIYE
jgi:mRNA interferase RelE/StbE